MKRPAAVLAVLALLAPPAWAGRQAPAGPVPAALPVAANPADAAVQAARAAAAEGDVSRLEALAPQAAGSLLEPYVDYWRASVPLRNPEPDDSRVRPFLTRYAGTVLADRLRADWLMALGARGDFATFDAERRNLVMGGDDAQLACYTLLARYMVDDGHRHEQIVRDARRTLATTTDPGGDGCTALATRLLDDGALSLWPRLQALVERSQFTAAQKAAARLAPADAEDLRRVLDQPAAWLAANGTRRDRGAYAVLALVVMARDTPDLAARQALRLESQFSPEERAIVWGRIGRSAQLELLPQAHEWFERGGDLVGQGVDSVRANETLEARARAALRRGAAATGPDGQLPLSDFALPAVADGAAPGPDWAALRKAIAQMPPELQADTGWIYWNARAQIALGHADEGRAALRGIADRFGYYGRLAAEQLGQPLVLAHRPPAPPAALVDDLAQRPGLLRARRLYELGLREEGNREWSWELRGMDDTSLLAVAEVARRFGVLDRMIASSERTRGQVDLGQRYPMPYPEAMAATSAPLGMDPAWVYGLIRQESRFIEDIRSSVGAVGLMQIMPSTARFVARRIGYENYRADRIADVNVNLRLGTEYLKLVLDDQDGQALLASAAYNAGPKRVRRWRAALARPLDGSIFVETIPISETREYVKRVLFNTMVYGALLDHPTVSLQSLLGPVVPRPVPATELP